MEEDPWKILGRSSDILWAKNIATLGRSTSEIGGVGVGVSVGVSVGVGVSHCHRLRRSQPGGTGKKLQPSTATIINKQ